MGDGASIVRIDRKSSIENEPITLTVNQMQCAREAALYVLNTRSTEEAMSIFTEGLEPLVNVGRGKGGVDFNGREMDFLFREEDDQLLLPVLCPPTREIASAPF